MRLVATNSVVPGMKLARPIYNDKGQTLLCSGVELSSPILQRLDRMGIRTIYVQDELTADIKYEERIPRELKTKAIQSIESTFKKIQEDSTIPNSLVMEKSSKDLMDVIRSIQEELERSNDLMSIISDVFAYDDYIFTHSFNVTVYTLALGKQLGLSKKDLEVLGLGALLHDIGKMNVPKKILLKPGKLTNQEFEYIKKHPVDGFNILRNVYTMNLLVAHCAYQHHERLNGSGYPRGIRGDEIHLFGKIIAVADVFDAVTSDRVYRDAKLPSEALEILFAGAGTLYDPNAIHAFRKSVAMYPVGITVQLSDGRKGVVSRQNPGVSDRPVVRVFEDNGRPVAPYEVDLMKKLSVVITNCEMEYKKSPYK